MENEKKRTTHLAMAWRCRSYDKAMTGLFLCSFAWYRKGVQVGQRKKEDFMSDRHIETMNQVFANIDAYNGSEIGQKAVTDDR